MLRWLSSEHRTISGRRRDLTGVRGPGLLRAIRVEGAGVASLRGIEAMTSLEHVALAGVACRDLERLASVPGLTHLVIERPRENVDLGVIEQLHRLVHLWVDVRGVHAGRVAALNLGALRGLEVLHLSVEGAPAPMMSTRWISRLTQLETIVLDGILVDADDAQRMAALPNCRQVILTPASRSHKQLISDAFGDSSAHYHTNEHIDYYDWDVIHRTPAGDWSLAVDLGQRWKIRTWAQLPRDVDAMFGDRAPHLRGFVEATAGHSCHFKSRRREDLEAVQRFVDSITIERGGLAPDVLGAPNQLGTIHDPGGGSPLSLRIDLASLWDLETTPEAEQRLRRLLRAREPQLAARLRYDSEADAVYVLADTTADLHALQQLVAHESSR